MNRAAPAKELVPVSSTAAESPPCEPMADWILAHPPVGKD
jgi:hypothetical protein